MRPGKILPAKYLTCYLHQCQREARDYKIVGTAFFPAQNRSVLANEDNLTSLFSHCTQSVCTAIPRENFRAWYFQCVSLQDPLLKK